MVILFVCLTTVGQAQGFSIQAEVDRDQIGFGESLNLVITISQSLNSGRAQRISIPAVSNIPGFDIASTRTGQSTTYINGVGQTRSQILYELVPQQAGKLVIPAFSFKDSEGNDHSTDPIEITVAEAKEAPAEPERQNDREQAAGSSGAGTDGLFRSMLLLGVILGAIIALPFVVSAFIGRKPSESPTVAETAPVHKMATAPLETEDAVILSDAAKVKNTRPAINFAEAVAALKREYPEVGKEFYRRYFDCFKEAIVGKSSSLGVNMTADELFNKICEFSPGEGTVQAVKRLGVDLEMVLYANRTPDRSFSAIDGDAREIIRAISE
jgi:hypothetical protein